VSSWLGGSKVDEGKAPWSTTPVPIDTTGIVLPLELDQLAERLANAHDQWALLRIQDGWRVGEKRDDAAKTHPWFVSYEYLPESEKDYDRRMAIETLL
jgi:RyR domain